MDHHHSWVAATGPITALLVVPADMRVFIDAVGTVGPVKSAREALLGIRERVDALDGWRTVSVALVIASHLLTYSNIRITGSDVLYNQFYLPTLSEMGALGVNIFFVISGFVIYRNLMIERIESNRVSISGFYARRAVRIMPPLIFYVGVIDLLSIAGVVDYGSIHSLKALTFTCNIAHSGCGGWLGGHTWSLSVEEQFYLIIPLLFGTGLVRGIGNSGILLGFSILTIASIATWIGQATVSNFVINFLPIGIGVALAANEKPVKRLVSLMKPYLNGIFIVGIFAAARFSDSDYHIVGIFIESIFIAGLLMNTAFGASQLKRWLSVAAMVNIGRASYGIYLWQQLATYPFVGAGVLFYTLSISTCVFLSVLSFRLAESPLIHFGRKLSRRVDVWRPLIAE
jgi:peptidoglycan/LPS O-acetylase OafA/YrhL